MNFVKFSTITFICVAIMWLLNPSLAAHRPVAEKHIRDYILKNEARPYLNKRFIPNTMEAVAKPSLMAV